MPILDHNGSAEAGAELFSSQVVEARRFFLGRRIGVVGAGVERVGADYRVHREGFEFVAIEFVAGGVGELILSGKKYRLIPGVCFTYGPGIGHTIVTDDTNRLVKYFVDASTDAGGRWLREAGLRSGAFWRTQRPADVARVLEEMLGEGRGGGRETGTICDLLFRALLLRAKATQGDLTIGKVAPAERGGAASGFATYQRCCLILESRAREIRTLSELADRTGTSSEYLCRLFRRYDRQSPYQRLVAARMGYAAVRLRGSAVLVQTVAKELGYADPFHFSRVFRQAFGIPPDRYRLGR